MARIVRADKMTLAALEATLPLFFNQAQAVREIPTLRLLARSRNNHGQRRQPIPVGLPLVDGIQ